MKTLLLSLLLLVCSIASAQTYYAVWNPVTLRYEFTTNAPVTQAPGMGKTITFYYGLPVAVDDNAITAMNQTCMIDVLANDIDMPFNSLSIYSVLCTNGTAYTSNGKVYYNPPLNYLGPVVFQYTVTDGRLNFSTAHVFVTVTNSGGGDITVTNGDGSTTTTNAPPPNGTNTALQYPGGLYVQTNFSWTTGKNMACTNPVFTNLVSNYGNPLEIVSITGGQFTGYPYLTNAVIVPSLNFTGVTSGTMLLSDTYTVTNTASITLTVTNAAGGLIPVMTSSNAPSGLAYASISTANAWEAFDGDTNTVWESSSAVNSYIAYQFPTAQIASSYMLEWNNGGRSVPTGWLLQGSNDGSTWSTLDTETGQNPATFMILSYNIGTPASYTYYRLYITSATGLFIGLAAMQLYGN